MELSLPWFCYFSLDVFSGMRDICLKLIPFAIDRLRCECLTWHALSLPY